MISKFIRYFGGGFLVLAVVAAAYGVAFSDSADKETAPTVEVDQNAISEYRELASELGLKYGQDYSYRDWRLETLKKFEFSIPEIGDCGTWKEPKDCEQKAGIGGVEYINCSHGRDNVGLCDSRGKGPHFETVYLTEHDVTLVTEISTEDDSTQVKILKVAKGKHPNLHQG